MVLGGTTWFSAGSRGEYLFIIEISSDIYCILNMLESSLLCRLQSTAHVMCDPITCFAHDLVQQFRYKNQSFFPTLFDKYYSF